MYIPQAPPETLLYDPSLYAYILRKEVFCFAIAQPAVKIISKTSIQNLCSKVLVGFETTCFE